MDLLSPFSLNLPFYEHKKRPSYYGYLSPGYVVLNPARFTSGQFAMYASPRTADSNVTITFRRSIPTISSLNIRISTPPRNIPIDPTKMSPPKT